MKRQKLLKIATAVLLAAGILVLFYPAVMNLIFVSKQNKVIDDYNKQIQSLSQSQMDEMKVEAQAYNDKLSNNTDSSSQGTSGNLSYSQLLSLEGGQMGYVVIPKISVNMPIYHNDSDDVLQIGVGHMENTSLPVGGNSTHCVLSGHSGVPGTKIFTDLTEMQVGDRFYIKSLNEVLCYRVDQIKTVLPNVTEDLVIFPDRDLVTLLTCTPYGVNTHRLLVRGTRVEYQGELGESFSDSQTSGENVYAESPATIDEQSLAENKTKLPDNFILNYIIFPVGIIIFVSILIILFKKRGKKQNKKERADEE